MPDLKKKSKNFFKSLKKVLVFQKFWPFFLILFLVLIFFYKTIIFGWIPFPGDFVVGVYPPWTDYFWGITVKNPIMADVPSFIYPMQTFGADLLKSGQWPLWNPHILAGAPLLANFQSAVFSPVNFFYFLFNQIDAWTIQIILSHFLAALFTFFLLREWQVSKLGSILGGIVFAFSGYNLIWSQWNGHVLVAALIPLILFFEDRFLKRGKSGDGIGISIAFTLQIYSGYPQTVIYTAVAIGLLWLVRTFDLKKIGKKEYQKKVIFRTIWLAVFFLLGLGLAAPQLLPGAELLSRSQWTAEGEPFEWAFLPWKKVITFLAPDFFGNHVTQNYWGPQDYTSNTAFVGLVAFVLASLGMKELVNKILIDRQVKEPEKERKKVVLYSFLLLVISLLLCLRTPISVFLWQYDIVGLHSSSAHRGLVLFTLAVSLLAAFGWDRLKENFQFKKDFAILLFPFLTLTGFAVYAFSLRGQTIRGIPISEVGLINLILPFTIFVFLSLILLVISKFKNERLKKIPLFLLFSLLVLELFLFGWKFTPFSKRELVFPKTPILEFLQNQEKPFRIVGSRVIPVNLTMPYGLEMMEGYDTMRPELASRFLAALNKGDPQADPAGRYGIIDNDTSRLLDLVNTKYYLTLKKDKNKELTGEQAIPERFKTPRFKLAFEDKSVLIMESKTALPRAFMVFDWEVEKTQEETLTKLLNPDFPLSEKIILDQEPEIQKTTEKGEAEVEYLEYTSQKSRIRVKTNKPGLLFISETNYPGWRAKIDNQETKIYKADYAFKAIPVLEGEQTITLEYQPQSFKRGKKIAVFSVLLLIIILVVEKWRVKRYT